MIIIWMGCNIIIIENEKTIWICNRSIYAQIERREQEQVAKEKKPYLTIFKNQKKYIWLLIETIIKKLQKRVMVQVKTIKSS